MKQKIKIKTKIKLKLENKNCSLLLALKHCFTYVGPTGIEKRKIEILVLKPVGTWLF